MVEGDSEIKDHGAEGAPNGDPRVTEFVPAAGSPPRRVASADPIPIGEFSAFPRRRFAAG